MKVIEVTSTTVKLKTDSGSITLTNGVKTKPRIACEVGLTTPAEYKKAIKQYFAITK